MLKYIAPMPANIAMTSPAMPNACRFLTRRLLAVLSKFVLIAGHIRETQIAIKFAALDCLFFCFSTQICVEKRSETISVLSKTLAVQLLAFRDYMCILKSV